MPAQIPWPGAVRDLLLATGVVLFAIGVGCLVLGLADGGLAASTPRAGAVVAPPREPGSAPARFHSSGSRRATPDRRPPPMPVARPQHAMDGAAFGAARAYLLEMSARLRHTTLGADAATRAAVAADFTYAYAWGMATDVAPERPGTPPFDGQATPTAIERAATPAPRRRGARLPGSGQPPDSPACAHRQHSPR